VLRGLKHYQSLHGEKSKVRALFIPGPLLSQVPKTFEVPKNDAAWPREFHCMKLGNALHGVRCGMTYKDRKEEFEALGLDVRVRVLFSPLSPLSSLLSLLSSLSLRWGWGAGSAGTRGAPADLPACVLARLFPRVACLPSCLHAWLPACLRA
jgi:hypothetical protein